MAYVKIPILRGFERVQRLFEIVSKDNLGFIAGGYLRYCCSPLEEIPKFRDVDVFTSGEESFWKLRVLLVQENLTIKHESDISISFNTSKKDIWKDCPEINLIKPLKENQLLTFGNTLETILDNFDFSICRVGAISPTECLADENFLEDERKKKIRILRMESPVACLVRLCKYANKGYRITLPTIMKVLKEWDGRGSEYHLKLFKALDRIYNKKMMGYTIHGEEETPFCEGSVTNFKNKEIIDNLIETCKPSVEEEIEDDLYHLIRIG